MQSVIRLGDPHSHGGNVISASGAIFAGKQVALVGDQISCPKKGHGINIIIVGHPTWKMHNRAVAINGCKAACGCVFISTLLIVGSE